MLWNAITLIGILAAVAVVTFFVFNRKALGKIGFLGKSQLGKVGRAAENADPVGQMRQAADDASEKIGKAREALVKAEAAKAMLERQVKVGQGEVATLTARINRRLDGGAPPTDNDIVRWSAELASTKKNLATDQAQLADNTVLCNESLKIIKHESDKIGDLKRRADHLEIRLDVSEAQAQVADIADNLRPDSISGMTNGAAKFEEIANRKIEENNARLRIAKELGGNRDEEETADVDGAAALEEILAARKHTAA